MSENDTHSRRNLLRTALVGSSTVLAGCGQLESGTSSGSPGGRGRTFRAPIQANDPSKTSFYLHAPDSTFDTIVKEPPSYDFRRFIWETGVWTDGLWVGGDIHYNWIEEPVEISPTEVRTTIREDAQWSDGHAVTGKDIAVPAIANTIRRLYTPYFADDGGEGGGDTDEQSPPEIIWAAIDDFEISDRSVTYRSEPGYFADFWDWTIETELGVWYPTFVPTHIDPYDDYADAVIETARRAQRGEIDPWALTKPWEQGSGDPNRKSLQDTHLGERKYVEKFSDPANVLTTGAWDLVELRGSEAFVFRKNPHHRRADDLDFDTVIFEYTPSEKRQRAALEADRLDYGAPGTTPQAVVDSFPEHLTQVRIPGGIYTGNELGLNFHHPALARRPVRQAIMYALDHRKIANNIHPSTAVPVETPGGDSWNATDFVSESFVEDRLTTYSTDRDRAASLMREAGFTRREGRWVDITGNGTGDGNGTGTGNGTGDGNGNGTTDGNGNGTADADADTDGDGEPISLTLATQDDTPRWEPTVASQLSEFGIETTVKSLGETTFSNRVENGEFPLFSHWGNATNKAFSTLLIWLDAARHPKKYGIYPAEQFATGQFTTDGWPRPRTEERWRVFTVVAPPVGKPEGPLQEYHSGSLSLLYFTNPPKAEFERRIKTGIWLANWFLPTIPISKTLEQHFVDDTQWNWDVDARSWQTFTDGGPRSIDGILASGDIRANPDAPNEGVSTDES